MVTKTLKYKNLKLNVSLCLEQHEVYKMLTSYYSVLVKFMKFAPISSELQQIPKVLLRGKLFKAIPPFA